jgi:hypothetical protein
MAIGRKTFPIAFPRFARATLSATIGIWSLYFSFQANSWMDYLPTTGLYVAYRFAKHRGPSEDKKSTHAYNVVVILFHKYSALYSPFVQLWLTMMNVYFAQLDRPIGSGGAVF